MSTSTLTLANFLLARFAEQRKRAEEAQERSSYGFADTAFAEAVELAEGEGARKPAIAHILGWDPVRVLAELEAKRLIVEMYYDALRDRMWATCTALERVLPLLALPYADHPGYRQEWKP